MYILYLFNITPKHNILITPDKLTVSDSTYRAKASKNITEVSVIPSSFDKNRHFLNMKEVTYPNIDPRMLEPTIRIIKFRIICKGVYQ